MKFVNLAKTYQQHLAGDILSDTDCAKFLQQGGFFDSIQYGKKQSRDNWLLAIFAIADQCEQIFILRHQANENICLVGAIMLANAPDKEQPQTVFSGGRGLDFTSAFCGCMEEMAERQAITNWKPDMADGKLPAIANLEPKWWQDQIANKLAKQEFAIAGNRYEDQAPVAFPWSRKDSLFNGSNGCAVGDSIPIAIERAALELAERHAVANWWVGGVAARNPAHEHYVQLFRVFSPGRQTTRHRWLLDLTCDNNIPVVAALSCASTGHGLIGGFAADKTMANAALRASMELCQMEAAADLAVDKRQQLGEDKLNDIDRLWLARLESSPVLHARPIADSPKSVPDIHFTQTLMDRIGTSYLFDMSPKNSPLRIVRLIAPDLFTMTNPSATDLAALSCTNSAVTSQLDEYPSVL